MSIGLLAGMGYAALGMAEGANKISKEERELTEREDELKQKASNVRMTSEHKRLSDEWDKTNKVIKSVERSGVDSEVGQYRLAKYYGDVTSYDEFKKVRGETVWSLPQQGTRPELNFVDVTELRAPSRRGLDVLTQAFGSDAEVYKGPSISEKERELLGEGKITYKETTGEDKSEILSRRQLQEELGPAVATYKALKSNLDSIPALKEKMLKLPEGSRDTFLRMVAKTMGKDAEDVTIAQSITRVLDLMEISKPGSTDDVVEDISDSLTNTTLSSLRDKLSDLNTELGSETRNRSDSTIKKEIKKVEADIKTERKRLTEQKKRDEKLLDERNKRIGDYNQKLDAWTSVSKAKDISRMANEFYTIIPGLSADMLSDDGEQTHALVHIDKHLTDTFGQVKSAVMNKVLTDAEYSENNLTPSSIMNILKEDAQARTIIYDNALVGDAVFIIPSSIVPFATPYSKEAWSKDFNEYMADAAMFYKNDDDAQQQVTEYIKELLNGKRPIPGTVEEEVTPEATIPADKKVGDIGHIITKTVEGKPVTYIRTADGYVPYNKKTNPTVVTSQEPVENPIYKQIAAIKLKAHNAEADVRKQASIDLRASTEQSTKDKIAEEANAQIAAIREQLKNDLAQFTGK